MTREYLTVTTIARLGNLTKAADALFLTQPALSKYLQSIEKEIGTPLFFRSGRMLELTPAGQTYVIYAEKIINLEQQMKMKIQEQISAVQPGIKVLCPLFLARMFTNRIISQFQKQYPDTKIQMAGGGGIDVFQRLLTEQADLLISYLSDDVSESFDYILIGQLERVVVAPSHHPLSFAAGKKPGHFYPQIDIHDILPYPFIETLPNSSTGKYVSQLFRMQNVHPSVSSTVSSISLIYQMIADGQGISILPALSPEFLPVKEKLDYFSFGEYPASESLAVFYLRGRTLSKQEMALIHLLREVFSRQ